MTRPDREMCDDLRDQFDRALQMLATAIQQLPAGVWRQGQEGSGAPAQIAYHTIDSLDFSFSGCADGEFRWGHRFGAPWWELNSAGVPDRDRILEYLDEMDEAIDLHMANRTDTDLAAPLTLVDWSGATLAGHLVYALRHTMHHQGQLAVLAREDTWR